MPRAPGNLDWLLQGDPAVRWQVMRDLLDEGAAAVTRERARVATEGWGARLLAQQDPDGRWDGAIYSPKWTSTTYTLLLLHWLGLPRGHAAAVAGCRQIWEDGTYLGGLERSRSRRPETCVTGMWVLLAASTGFEDPRVDKVVRWLLGQQGHDGGWNCAALDAPEQHGSLHTTITALDALLAYRDGGGPVPVEETLERGRRFFLEHRLYRSHRIGEVAISASTRFPFPPQWHFDVLRGLEHFAASGAEPDERLADAVAVVRSRRRTDGRWPTYAGYSGRTWFRLEEPGPSRLNTLRALRVLRWWGDPVNGG